ncbi:MAG: hypothetical protein NW223_21870 [Hyphomicrobiaceae bacterium]|nr:hypothetical protein [Hyphomicrobiaceae bacterium]
MTRSRQSRCKALRAAILLLAVLALVFSRSVTATAGLALPAIAGHLPSDCPSHAAAAHAPGHHHEAIAVAHDAHHAGPQTTTMQAGQAELPPLADLMPCCVTAAAIVIPVADGMPLPTLTAAGAFAGARCVVLRGLGPEGPSEPPRTSDQG